MADPNLVQLRLEQARQELLDLGLRNPLLNHVELASHGLRIVDALADRLFRLLVIERRSLAFAAASGAGGETTSPEDGSTPLLGQPPESPDSAAARHRDDRLRTPYRDPQLQLLLRRTSEAARVHLEESGVNVLYLALGMLRWFEGNASDQARWAPLALVPVELSRADAQSRFELRYTQADVTANHALEAKLRRQLEFGLPAFPAGDNLSVASYLEAVSATVAPQRGWSVDTEMIRLGFFCFSKLRLYEDLDSANWPPDAKPHDHPLLGKLLDEGLAGEPLNPSLDDSLDESIAPGDLVHVVDADSAQTVAIQNAARGSNLVVQGPPGTGKSQTITNLVAEALAADKRVLLVAQKRAAVDDVRRRLAAVGLGDVIADLHHHGANASGFLDELDRTLSLGIRATGERGALVATLTDARARLNDYARAVNAPIKPSNLSPHAAYGRLLTLQDKLEDLSPPELDTSGFARWDDSHQQSLLQDVQDLEALLRRCGSLENHPFWGSAADVFLPTLDGPLITERAMEARQALAQLAFSVGALASRIGLSPPTSLGEVTGLLRGARRLLKAPALQGVDAASPAWLQRAADLRKAIEVGARLRSTRLTHRALRAEAWDAEVGSIRGTLANYRDRWWRLLSPHYRRARKALTALWRSPVPPAIDDQLQALDAILTGARLQRDLAERQDLLEGLYGEPGDESTDWSRWTRIAEYLQEVHREVASHRLPAAALGLLAAGPLPHDLRPLTDTAEAAWSETQTALAGVAKAARFGGANSLQAHLGSSFPQLDERLERWQRRPGQLQDIATFNRLSGSLAAQGLSAVLSAARDWQQAPQGLVALFQRARLAALLEQAWRQRPLLATFNGRTHEQVVERFREAEEKLLEVNRLVVAAHHRNGLPGSTRAGQAAVLALEIDRVRGHRPIRQLMIEAGRAIQAIKPVFLMSPASVATYIPPGSVQFDLVVFDEASQIQPVAAFGALLRARQAVVVGDSCQLPPIPLFDRLLAAKNEGEWEHRTSGNDSILDLFVARGAPECALDWHYRSHHESLIAVANQELYGGRLTVFPSPDTWRSASGLVVHHLPDTHYERRPDGGVNRREAQAVARAAVTHARDRAGLTLGVVAFGQAQAQVILDELEILRRQDHTIEPFFAGHREGSFFVKSVEDVQGDERDVVFLSVGYGRTREGYLSMNFGPLNQDGGERYLNVLITRARRRCEVFTNLRHTDIDLSRSDARGVLALQRFLRFAELDQLDLEHPSSPAAESVFEDHVAEALRAHGHSIARHVGSAGCTVDLAVEDRHQPGRFLLGILCDGAAYHSARWARDRDRLRPGALGKLGWTLHRIWSTDWFRNPQQELRRTLQAIEQAAAAAAAAAARDAEEESFAKARAAAEQVAKARAAAAPPYQLANPQVEQDLLSSDPPIVAGWVAAVVEVESPVHPDEVIARISSAAGFRRTGRRIRKAISAGVRQALRDQRVRRDEQGFLWSPDRPTPTPRDRSVLPNASRKMELVCPAEVQMVILAELRAAKSMPRDALSQAVCRQLGFARVTENMSSYVHSALEPLLQVGAVALQSDTLRVAVSG